jgi:2-methylisocitrate lyase-like PEP mutase family enzyme
LTAEELSRKNKFLEAVDKIVDKNTFGRKDILERRKEKKDDIVRATSVCLLSDIKNGFGRSQPLNDAELHSTLLWLQTHGWNAEDQLIVYFDVFGK